MLSACVVAADFWGDCSEEPLTTEDTEEHGGKRGFG
jgi:hypothetical protein